MGDQQHGTAQMKLVAMLTASFAAMFAGAPPVGASDDWKPALLYPIAGMKLPAGVAVKEIPDAAAFVLVDHGGYTLYEFIGGERSEAEKCALTSCKNWRPFIAAQLAEPIGDFTAVDRSDGGFRMKKIYPNLTCLSIRAK
jgi:predicted lipoprotein with Yx(FWY)xxD motif